MMGKVWIVIRFQEGLRVMNLICMISTEYTTITMVHREKRAKKEKEGRAFDIGATNLNSSSKKVAKYDDDQNERKMMEDETRNLSMMIESESLETTKLDVAKKECSMIGCLRICFIIKQKIIAYSCFMYVCFFSL